MKRLFVASILSFVVLFTIGIVAYAEKAKEGSLSGTNNYAGTIFESIGTKTESESSDSDPLEQISQNVNKLRVPGYFAYHLAQEALTLLNLIAASTALPGGTIHQYGLNKEVKVDLWR